jgi:two-component system, cell cycle sensor histidine kinase and response regulator CckA
MSTGVIESQQVKTLRVLLVEDNPLDVRLVLRLLEPLSRGVPCRHVTRLSLALVELSHEQFDVVLLDLNLDDSNGFDTFVAIREAAADAAILVLSGSESVELAIRTVREGAQDYLVKGSFDQKLLLRAIQYALERKASEDALRKSEATVRAIFESSLDGILIWDDNCACLQANAAAAALICVSREELLGNRVCSFAGAGLNIDVQAEWSKIRNADSARGQVWITRGDGERRLFDYSFKSNIQPGKHLGVLRDITEQQSMEEQLRQSQKMEAVGRLAGGVAHDFNNILGVITGYAELMMLNTSEPGQRKKAEQIISASEKAAALTNQLLAFGRKQVIAPRLINLMEVVSGLKSMITCLMSAETSIVLDWKQPVSMVNADQSQLEQIVLNLATNARQAMPAGGKLTVSVDEVENHSGSLMPAGRYVRLTVSDTGAGIKAEHLSRIFEPFFSTKPNGTGLGLSTVYGIAKQSGGFVTVDSEFGHGATFSVYLPAIEGSYPQVQSKPAAVKADPQGAETILMVDDEDRLRDAMKEYLELRGYKVITARDGQEAVEVSEAFAGKIDLMITDVTMPRMNGRRLVEHMREARPAMKILVMSGYADDEKVRMGFLESELFVQKPFSLQVLNARVRELLHPDAS